jgi:hypothetical protein
MPAASAAPIETQPPHGFNMTPEDLLRARSGQESSLPMEYFGERSYRLKKIKKKISDKKC